MPKASKPRQIRASRGQGAPCPGPASIAFPGRPQLGSPPNWEAGPTLLPQGHDRFRTYEGLSPRLVTGSRADMKVTTGLPSLVFRAAGESLVPTPVEHLRGLAP